MSITNQLNQNLTLVFILAFPFALIYAHDDINVPSTSSDLNLDGLVDDCHITPLSSEEDRSNDEDKSGKDETTHMTSDNHDISTSIYTLKEVDHSLVERSARLINWFEGRIEKKKMSVKSSIEGNFAKIKNSNLEVEYSSALFMGGIPLSFTNPILESGVALQDGAVYRFTNVTAGVDALITIVGRDDSDMYIINFDVPGSSFGHDAAWQPSINAAFWNNPTCDTAGTELIEFDIQFVLTGTSTATTLSDLDMTAIDVDGNSFSDIREVVSVSGYDSYSVGSPSDLTLTGSLEAMGPLVSYGGIDTSAQNIMVSFMYSNVSQINVKIGNNFGGNCTISADEGRMASLYFKDFALPINIAVCGTSDNDGDGVFDICDLDDDNDGILDDIEALGIDSYGLPTGCSLPLFDFTGPVLESGINGQVGAIYRYSNVIAGTDALVTIVSLTNVTVDSIDSESSGFVDNFQPVITSTAIGTVGMEINFRMVDSGTSTSSSTVSRIGGTAYDIDGNIAFARESLFFEGNVTTGTEDTSLVYLTNNTNGHEYTASGTLAGIGIDPDTKFRVFFSYIDTNSITIHFQQKTNTIGGRRFSVRFDECEIADFSNINLNIQTGLDRDNDGIEDHIDLDSDNDGIYDAIESGSGDAQSTGRLTGGIDTYGIPLSVSNGIGGVDYSYANTDIADDLDAYDTEADGDGCFDTQEENVTDGDSNGVAGTGVPTVDANGLVTSITYNVPPNNNWQNSLFSSCLPTVCIGDPMGARSYDVWHTGSGGGLDFGQMQTIGPQAGYPSTFIQTGTNSNMPKREGGATFCDPSTGEVLIYSDGEKGWDKVGNEYVTADVSNRFNTTATNLSSAAGTPIIVATPGQCNSVDELYIFFTDDHNGTAPELYYVIVDVPNKTIGLPTQLTVAPTSEQINAVQISCDTIWIVYREGVDLNAVRWTPSGFEAPVVTPGIHKTSDQRYRSAFSLDGTKFAASIGGAIIASDSILVADFNQVTGQFFNPYYLDPRPVIPLPLTLNTNYGVAFSPDATKLYTSVQSSSPSLDYLVQYDLSAGSVSNIQSSLTTLGSKGRGFGGIQNAPDGRLYISNGDGANNGLDSLHVIDFPNLADTACNLRLDFLNTGGLTGSGLNNIVYGLGPSACIPIISAAIGGNNPCEEIVINTNTNACYLGAGGPYDVYYTFEGIEDTLFNQSPIGDSIVITGLTTGRYTNIHVTDASGCPSNYVDLILAGLSCQEICDNGIDDDLDGLADCNDPDCSSSCPTDSCSSRVGDGLIAFYNFKESVGDTVFDVSAQGTVAPLIIQDPVNITRLSGCGISINSATIISSNTTANKIIDSLSFSNALTLEAWIKPVNNTQDGPARIITISSNILSRNITLGQDSSQYLVRLRTSTTNTNGSPEALSPVGTVNTSIEQHIVFTWDGTSGTEIIYIDGVVVYTGIRLGYLNNWDDYQIAIGNEFVSTRPWLGEIYSVGIYNRALDSLEVVQNVIAGYCCAEICNNGVDDDNDGDIDLADLDCACSSTDQNPLWVVDEDSDPSGLHLWSYSDYTDANTGVDYGRLNYFDPSTSTIRDAGDAQDMESMAINTYTGLAYFMSDGSTNNGPGGAQALFQYDLNDAVLNQGNIVLTVIGHITKPSGRTMEALAFDEVNNRFYTADPVDGGTNSSIVADTLYYIDLAALNANPLLASSPVKVGEISGMGESNNYVDGLEFGDSGKLYSIDGTDEHLYEIDPATGAILAVIDNNLAGGTGHGSVDIETITWDAGAQKMIAIDNQHTEFIGMDLTTNGNNSILMDFSTTAGIPAGVDFEGSATFDACQPKMTIGNLIFKDNNSSGTYDNGEGLDSVVVALYQMGADVSTASPLDTTLTAGGGFYVFEKLKEGGYFIHLPASEFGSGKPLEFLISVSGSGGDNQVDNEDNGVDVVDPKISGLSSDDITLTEDLEPINATTETGAGNTSDDSDDDNGDMTVDMAFITASENCTNGIDDDGDGLIDCADGGDCETPSLTFLTANNPDNCPLLTNGSIVITATGSNLEYSKDNGSNYQASNTFSNLTSGSYNIIIRDSISLCEDIYASNPVAISDPVCVAVCDTTCQEVYRFNWWDGSAGQQWVITNGEASLTRNYTLSGGQGNVNVDVTMTNNDGQNIDFSNCGTDGNHFYTATCNDPNAGVDCDSNPVTTDGQFSFGCDRLSFGITSNNSNEQTSFTFDLSTPTQICEITIGDIDYDGSSAGLGSWQDEIDITADSSGTPVAITVINGGGSVVTNNNTPNVNILSIYNAGVDGNLGPEDPQGHALITTLKEITSLTITYSNGPDDDGPSDDHAIWISSFDILVPEYPSVTLSLPDTTECASSTTLALSGGNPIGGSYSGTGVTGSNFDASTAGLGTHTITYTYTDGNGCTNTATDDITVFETPVITNVVGVDPTDCDTPDGSITITATTGFGIIEYRLNSGTWQSSNVFSGLGSGSYNVDIRNSNGTCIVAYVSNPVVLDVPQAPTANIQLPAAVCLGEVASITAQNAGGSATYVWDFGAGATPATANTRGPHNVTYSSAGSKNIVLTVTKKGCVAIDNKSYTVFALPVVTYTQPDTEECTNSTTLALSGGSPSGGLYSGTGVSGTNFDASLAGVGTHTITYTFTDVNGCIASATDDITVIRIPDVTNITHTDETCDSDDGTITFTFTDDPSNTSLEFSIDDANSWPPAYNVNDNSGTFTISNLSPATYDLWVRWGDDKCPVDLGGVVIDPEPIPIVTGVVTNNPYNCPALDNGAITVLASGSNLKYSNNNGATFQQSNVFNNLAVGSYIIQVLDSITGCIVVYGSNPVTTNPQTCVELCFNGIDDDNDGLIDENDPDCADNCIETVMILAQDGGVISQKNINTGSQTVLTYSPYTSSNLNALAANPDAQIVYYGRGQTVYYWDPSTDIHGILLNMSSLVPAGWSLTSGGGAYYSNYVYMGFETSCCFDDPLVYRIPVSSNGLTPIGDAEDLNIPFDNRIGWGDLITSRENGDQHLYMTLGNNYNGFSTYAKYNLKTAVYSVISTTMTNELQIGVDIDGDLWGGGVTSGFIRRINKVTGNYYGGSVGISGNMWDLSGPINCAQKPEICDNGVDDDGDGLVDCADPDCTGDGNADVVFSSSGVVNKDEALGVPDGVAAQLYDNGDQMILDLADIVPQSQTYTITWRKNGGGSSPSVLIEESTDGVTYVTAIGAPFSISTTTYFETDISASVDTRYLRVTTQNNFNVDFDAVGYSLRCATFCPTATTNPHIMYYRAKN